MRETARLRFDGLFGALGERLVGRAMEARRNTFPLVATMVGIAVCVSLLAGLDRSTDTLLLIGSFGASSILVFAEPGSDFSQPWNVVVGHLLAAGIGVIAVQIAGGAWWALGPTVGLAYAAMRATRSVHPPAGADPIIMVMRHAADPSFVFVTVLAGTLVMVTLAVAWHARVTGRAYPVGSRFPPAERG